MIGKIKQKFNSLPEFVRFMLAGVVVLPFTPILIPFAILFILGGLVTGVVQVWRNNK